MALAIRTQAGSAMEHQASLYTSLSPILTFAIPLGVAYLLWVGAAAVGRVDAWLDCHALGWGTKYRPNGWSERETGSFWAECTCAHRVTEWGPQTPMRVCTARAPISQGI